MSKFYSDYSADAAIPYLVFEEVGESYEFMTAQAGVTGMIATGNMMCRIYQYSRAAARQLGFLVCAALNDLDLQGVTWNGVSETVCTLKVLRMGAAAFMPVTDIGPGVSTTFQRVIQFDYVYNGYL